MRGTDSLAVMIRERTLRKRRKLVETLPITGELLRGSLLERVVRHKSGCPKCARGEGHQVYVLTVGYGRGQTRQISVRRERVAEVRRWLDNYQKLKATIEQICGKRPANHAWRRDARRERFAHWQIEGRGCSGIGERYASGVQFQGSRASIRLIGWSAMRARMSRR